MRVAARALAALALVAALPAAAREVPSIPVEYPVIREIVFTGNAVTREKVMRREMIVTEGDPADPERVERSRQGIQDLGLFKSVSVSQTPVEGGVRLTVSVAERWYILPVPRADANADGQSSYGLSLRWYNVAGYNHTLRGTWVRKDEERENQGASTRYSLDYSMPFLFETPYGLGLSVGYLETPITEFGGYLETVESVGVSLRRAFSFGPASQGWSGSVFLSHKRHKTDGPTAPEPYGREIAPGIGVGYRNVRDNIYSNEGVHFSADVSGAGPQTGSDYAFVQWSANAARFFRVRQTAHQNLNVLGSIGSYHEGPKQYRPNPGIYSLGGSTQMRGYESDSLEGDAYAYATVEYLQPILRDWMRGVVSLEAASVHPDLHGGGEFYSSAGLGLRFRVTFLVDLELNLGVAVPLDNTDEVRFYASKL